MAEFKPANQVTFIGVNHMLLNLEGVCKNRKNVVEALGTSPLL